MQVTYDKNSLIIDGKREFIRCGAFHYFRTPGVELAYDRFMKLKAAGYNAVDIYFNANYHSKEEGVYDFGYSLGQEYPTCDNNQCSRLGLPAQQDLLSEIKNVKKILQAAKNVGLFVIARPGPFINAEVNAGGLPFWLLQKKNVIPRNRIGTQYQYSPEYMDFVKSWYDVIIPIINEFDNIIAFQIENEYATDEMEEDYMRELYQMARDRGIKCPIFHNDAFHAGLWADVVDIYADDIYPYINPSQNWKQDHFCFDSLDNFEDLSRCAKEDAPMFIAEMQGGWFDKWDGIGYKAMREALGDEHINIVTKTAISQGVTMFNHYMAAGGTSWDDLACDEVYTSYEFTAGIDEYGSIQPNFYKAKAINYFLNSFGLTNTGERENLELGENIYAVKRHDFENNCDWLFVRNMNADDVGIEIPTYEHTTLHSSPFTLHPYDMKIMPQNLKLNACKIEFSDVEIFARLKNEKDEVLFMIADKDAKMHIAAVNPPPHPNPLPAEEREHSSTRKIEISGNKKDYENVSFELDGKTTQFVFISKELANRTWIVDDKVIFNADFVYSNGRIALSKTTEIAYFDLKNGFSKKIFKFQEEKKEISLKNFDVSFCAPELDTDFDYSHWEKILKPYDAISIGKYNEFIWYKAQIPNYLEEITLSARHLFSVYINGKEILNRNSYKYEKLQQIEETISIKLNKTILNKEQNELTILVQNLGFDKGFSGETNNPRGLVSFDTKPESDIEFYVNEGLSLSCKESESPYLTKLSANFDCEFKENVIKSMYLSMEKFPYDRATIFLNGIKIGRYLKNSQNKSLQTDFYLINTFLKPQNSIDIVVWERDTNIKTAWDFKNELKHVIMYVGDKDIHQLY